MFLNVWALTDKGLCYPTKAAFKRAMADNPHSVTFHGTSMFGPKLDWPKYGDELPADYNYSVVGPDPDKKRDWYATVTITAHGIRVK